MERKRRIKKKREKDTNKLKRKRRRQRNENNIPGSLGCNVPFSWRKKNSSGIKKIHKASNQDLKKKKIWNTNQREKNWKYIEKLT